MSGPLRDVVAHQHGFVHVPHDQVLPVGVLVDLRGGRTRFLVGVLAVDDGGEPVACVALHALPHVKHRAARGIHQNAADLPQGSEVLERDPEGRDDHHVVGGEVGEVEDALGRGVDEADAHLRHPLVHVRVVDDLPDQEDALVGELVDGLVGIVHRAVDAVAESELLGEAHGDVAEGVGVAPGADAFHQRGVVLRVDDRLELLLEPETSAEVRLLHDSSGSVTAVGGGAPREERGYTGTAVGVPVGTRLPVPPRGPHTRTRGVTGPLRTRGSGIG